MLADPPGVGADLVGLGVPLGRHGAGFLEQRHVDVRFDIACRAGIAVPVPRPAEIAADFDDADAFDARLAQPRRGQQTTETTADDHDVDRIVDRRPLLPRAVRIGVELGEAGDVEIRPVAVGGRPAVPLDAVPLAQHVEIERRTLGYITH